MKNTIKVLHFSSHDEDCGVGKYQEQYLVGMANIVGVTNKFFDSSPYKTRLMDEKELIETFDRLETELKDYDILHIQHEFGFFSGDEFRQLVSLGKRAGKKVIVTIHTAPSFVVKEPTLGGLGPRSFVKLARDWRLKRIIDSRHLQPFREVDLLIVHNDQTIKSLEKFGVSPQRIKKIIMPVAQVPTPPPSDVITKQLQKKSGDIIYCTVGFLHRYKGIEAAIRALKFLPSNYKLAIVGGLHPTSDEVTFYDKVTNIIDQLGLHDRVYITGFIQDDDVLNSLLRECDVCIYPYDRVYYANVTSATLNLAFANALPVVAYPTLGFKEVVADSPGAIALTDTFSYYELARTLRSVDTALQSKNSKAYAEKYAWPIISHQLVAAYQSAVA